jgi:hypothetical protein
METASGERLVAAGSWVLACSQMIDFLIVTIKKNAVEKKGFGSPPVGNKKPGMSRIDCLGICTFQR